MDGMLGPQVRRLRRAKLASGVVSLSLSLCQCLCVLVLSGLRLSAMLCSCRSSTIISMFFFCNVSERSNATSCDSTLVL